MHGRGDAWQGACMTGKMATAADGTHPTGMLPCFDNKEISKQVKSSKILGTKKSVNGDKGLVLDVLLCE